MKKCLITGAGGNVGLKLLELLTNNEELEITAIDLKNTQNKKNLDKYKNKINVLFADITDHVIMKSLIKDHDVIFHLAGVLPPYSEIHHELVSSIDYKGTKGIVDMINEYNSKAHLFYLSTTCLYGDNKIVDIKSDINIYNDDYYSQNKYKSEIYIEKNLSKYTIYRIPLILNESNLEDFIYNIPLNRDAEIITADLVAQALAKSIPNLRKLNKKIFNLSGGKEYQTTTNELLKNVLKVQGIGWRYISMRTEIPKNFYTHLYKDSQKLNEILDFQKGSINDVYNNLGKLKKFKRCLNRLFAYITINKLSK